MPFRQLARASAGGPAGTWYAALGEPNEDESDGGGTDGYERMRAPPGPSGAAYGTGGVACSDAEDAGVVSAVPALVALAPPFACGCVAGAEGEVSGEM